MRLIVNNNSEVRRGAIGATLALFVVAWFVIGQCSVARGQAQPQWISTQGSSQPWGESESGARIDAIVQPVDFRSAGSNSIQKIPSADFKTQNVNAEVNGQPANESSSINLEFDLPKADAAAQADWTAGFRELLRAQAGSVNWTRMLGSLAIVVAGYLILVWLFRLASPGKNGRLPSSVFELVGSARLNSRQSLQVVRVGSRLLMLIVSPEGAQAVGEISHPGEVESLVAECESGGFKKGYRSKAASGAFASGGISGAGRDTSALLEQLVQSLQKSAGQRAARTEFEV